MNPEEQVARYESLFPAGPMSTRGGASIPPNSIGSPMSMRGAESMSAVTLNAAIKRTLEVELRNNPRLVIFGEDVGPMGGLYGTTTSLQTRFGSERVFDTSLSEEGIIGRAVGMALAGLMPVPEIQARKYIEPAADQLSNCGSMRWRTAGRFAAPMVIRMPCGVGPKAGDPFHAVTGEGIFAHTAGLRVAFPSNAEDAVGLLRSALRGNDPTIFLEHRTLLYAPIARRFYPGDQFMIPFGLARVVQEGEDLTVVTWGETVFRCITAAEELPNRIEIIDLRTIVPWDKQAVLRSVRKTRRCLIAHEETLTCGFGAEIAATLAQEAFFDLDAPICRVAMADHPTPYNTTLLKSVAPTAERIRAEMKKLLASNF
jgi:2-oxoisovalerate dehydrogenase E1 component